MQWRSESSSWNVNTTSLYSWSGDIAFFAKECQAYLWQMTDRFLNDISGIKLYFCSSGANCWELQPLNLKGSQIRAHPPNCRVESDSEIGSHFITGFCHQFNGSHSIRPKLPSTHPTVRLHGQHGFCKRMVFLQPHHEVHAIQLIWQYPIQDLFECIQTFLLQETGPALSNSQKYWSQEMWGRNRCCSTEHQSVKHRNASKFKRHTVLNWLPGLFKMFSKADLLFSQT